MGFLRDEGYYFNKTRESLCMQRSFMHGDFFRKKTTLRQA